MALPGLLSGQSPNGRLNHAVVGCDGQGWSDLSNIASHPNVHVAAICDVDTARMGKAAAKSDPALRKRERYRPL